MCLMETEGGPSLKNHSSRILISAVKTCQIKELDGDSKKETAPNDDQSGAISVWRRRGRVKLHSHQRSKPWPSVTPL